MSKRNAAAARAKANLDALRGKLPQIGGVEAAKGMPAMEPPAAAPDGGMMGGAPGGPPGVEPPPAPGALPGAPGAEEEKEDDEEGEGDPLAALAGGGEGLKSQTDTFLSGCATKTCGSCLRCIEGSVRGVAHKAAPATIEPAPAEAIITSEVLARMVSGAVQHQLGAALAPIAEALKGIMGTQDLLVDMGSTQLEFGLKSAQAMGIIAAQPAQVAQRGGVAVGSVLPGGGSAQAVMPSPGAGFQFTEEELYKAVDDGHLGTMGMQDLWNMGHQRGQAPRFVNLELLGNVPNNLRALITPAAV